MSIRSEVEAVVIDKKPKFPCVRLNIKLGEEGSAGTVVLFTSATTGVVIHSIERTFAVGIVSSTWVNCGDVSQWVPCTITLTSET